LGLGLEHRHVLDPERNSAFGSLAAERTLFEFTHPEVGQVVAERGDLPARHIAAIAHHHAPDASGDEHRFCTLIGLGNRAAHAALDGFVETLASDQDAARLRHIGLRPGLCDACPDRRHAARPTIDGFVGAIR